MKDFWTYETDLPAGEKWQLFGKEHILWLVILIGSAVFLLAAHHKRKKTGSFLFRLCAFFSLFWQLAQAAYRMILGVYDIGTLPLHVCSLASYLVFLYAVTRWKWLGEILYFPVLPGAFLAILFPDWTMYPAVSFMSIAGFLVHWSIDMTVLVAMEDKKLHPSVQRIWAPVLFLSVYAAILIPFDHCFHLNYGFLNVPSPGSPLIAVADIFGSGAGYYFGYAVIVAVCLAAAYGIVYACTNAEKTFHF